MILYFSEGNPLGHTLLERCRKADYECGLAHSHYQVLEQLGKVRHHDQAVVVADTHSSMSANLEDFTEYVRTKKGEGVGGSLCVPVHT